MSLAHDGVLPGNATFREEITRLGLYLRREPGYLEKAVIVEYGVSLAADDGKRKCGRFKPPLTEERDILKRASSPL